MLHIAKPRAHLNTVSLGDTPSKRRAAHALEAEREPLAHAAEEEGPGLLLPPEVAPVAQQAPIAPRAHIELRGLDAVLAEGARDQVPTPAVLVRGLRARFQARRGAHRGLRGGAV